MQLENDPARLFLLRSIELPAGLSRRTIGKNTLLDGVFVPGGLWAIY